MKKVGRLLVLGALAALLASCGGSTPSSPSDGGGTPTATSTVTLTSAGASPVAMSLAVQARQLGYHVTLAAPVADRAGEPDAHVIIDGFEPRYLGGITRSIVTLPVTFGSKATA